MYLYSFSILVFLLSLSPAHGETCGAAVLDHLRVELGRPIRWIPEKLRDLDGVGSVSILGAGDAYYGGAAYLVTFTNGQRKVFKIYNYVNRASVDLAAMTRLRFDQESGKNLGFKIPNFKQRRDLGPQVVEIDHVEGTSLEKILWNKNVDSEKKERLRKIYDQKVQTLVGHFKANYDTQVHKLDYPVVLEVSGNQLQTQLEILVKHDNIIVTPNEEMYFIDPY